MSTKVPPVRDSTDSIALLSLVPVLRGSTPQEGDPLGIYPGGGLDPRIDPALVPAARAQLAEEVRLLQTELDILTRRLGVSRAREDNGGLLA